MAGGADANSLNMIYNIADVLNKIGFCLAIWAAADSTAKA
jgi:lipoprotein signal peptidase